jgi:hypothetical protein
MRLHITAQQKLNVLSLETFMERRTIIAEAKRQSLRATSDQIKIRKTARRRQSVTTPLCWS